MSRGALVVVLCSVLLAACGAPVEEAAVEPAMPAPAPAPAAEAFVPREVVPTDIPADIQEDSWARLPTLARDTLDAEGQRVFDRIVGPESRYSTGLRGPVGMWMYSPGMAEHIFAASTYLRFGADGQRDQRLAELAILATARELNSQYEWSAHEPLARTAGLEDEIIALVRSGAPLTDEALPGLGEPERTIIRVARELITAPKLSREAFESAQRLFGNEGVMDLAGLIGYYTFVNFTLKTFDVQRAPGTQLLLPLP
ncbi:MAG: carboxymuconolactone decarboxylase family protein [Acidobacteria bacterium]|nr:carboxymuconolactone decarboxylase family protein [Acidobacteriota bacterium]